MLRRILLLVLIIGTGATSQAQAARDPNLLMPEVTKQWKTLSTPNFRIHHEASQKEYAQNLAAIAERVHGRLSGWLEWEPREATEVVLLDTADISNGHASPVPYNNMTIFLQPPTDGELLDQMPWLEMVFTHEYVHTLHLDSVSGAPQVMRDIFGRSSDLFIFFAFPQLFAPTWVAEGLAVYGESDNASTYGRLNSAFYDAMMRMEVQRGLASLTEVSYNSGHRWPYGQQYLYGAYFFKFVEAYYGRDAVTKYVKMYGRNMIPFRMQNRSYTIFGKSGQEVWTEYQDYLTRRFTPQLEAIKKRSPLQTRTVYDTPFNNTSLAAAQNGDLYFLHDDASTRPLIRRLRKNGGDEAVLDGLGVQDIDWHGEAGLLLNKYAVCDNTNVYIDLYQWKQGMSSAKRLTRCGRYTFARWRPDGRAIAAIQSERGVSRLQLLDASGKQLKTLAEFPLGENLGHLDWSPDGSAIVAAIQRKKTGWNLELLDVQTQQWQALTADMHLLQRPKFSKDGKEIYFLSDQGKVWNLRRMKRDGGKIETLSNTLSAITDAVQMPDSSFRLVEYTGHGQAIIALQAGDTSGVAAYGAVNPAAGTVNSIVNQPDYQPAPYTNVKDYSPWHTLKPHSWFPLLDIGSEQASYIGVMVGGADALDFHQWNAVPLYYFNQRQLGGLANYSFYNTITLSAQREFFLLGDRLSTVRTLEDELRYQALLHHSFNAFDSSLYLAAGAASEAIKSVVLKGSGTDQAYNNKIAGGIVQFDNSRAYKNSISPVEGRRMQLVSETYDVFGGGDYSGRTTRIDWHEYFALGDNHALHLRALRAESDPTIRAYRLGGVSEVLSKIGGDTGLGRRDFPLRGYASGTASLTGSNMGLFSAEWKIPLGYHYDGWFVPPFGLGRESLTLFVDTGDAWNQGETVQPKTGVGLEWNAETLLGYDLLRLTVTLGLAQGLNEDGESRLYARLSLPFM